MNHYEVLGVKPDATDEEIKRAYRKRAAETHPDKPENKGREDEFKAIAGAYEVLGDAVRRKHYDETGRDEETPVEKEARDLLIKLFREALGSTSEVEVVAFAKTGVSNAETNLGKQKTQIEARRKKLEKRRAKVEVAEGEMNLVHGIIDQELNGIEQALAEGERLKGVLKLAKEMLDKYVEQRDAPAQGITMDGFFPRPIFKIEDFQLC